MKKFKSLFVVTCLSIVFFASCQKEEDNRGDAKAMVTVVDKNNIPIKGVTVRMYDEQTYAAFVEDEFIESNDFAVTNSDGVASFDFSYAQWFSYQRERVFTFVVQNGFGDNIERWSAGRAIRPGADLRVEIKLEEPKP